jgi:hypothetical protein
VVGYHTTDESSQYRRYSMKLFAVRLPDGSLVVSESTGEPVFFDGKIEAKRLRDRYDGAVVVLGPDHRRYKN